MRSLVQVFSNFLCSDQFPNASALHCYGGCHRRYHDWALRLTMIKLYKVSGAAGE